jgi:hypothetical protein
MTSAATLLLWLVATSPIPDAAEGGWVARLRAPPGLLVLASGPRDLELAPRGLTESGTRRLAVALDGRELTLPVFGGLDPAAPGVPVEEVSRPTLEAGPGAGAGVRATAAGRLDLVTRSSRGQSASSVVLGGGERDAGRLGLKATGVLARATVAGWVEAERDGGFRASRTSATPQPGQPLEAVALARDQEDRLFGGFRLEWAEAAAAPSVVVAGGFGRGRGAVRTTPFGRAEERRADDRWLRAELATPRWDLGLAHTGHDAVDLVLLGTGAPAPLDERRTALDGRLRWARGRVRLTLGAELGRDEATAGGPAPILDGDATVDRVGTVVAGEVDLARRVALGFAGRWSSSDGLPEDVLTGRLRVAWAPHADHRLEASWGEGLVEPTLAERHIRWALGPPVDLGIFERAFGLTLGFDAVPTVAFGDPALRPERVSGLELAYRGRTGPVDLSIHAFEERHRDFVGDFLLGTGPARPAYAVPATVPPEVARRFLATLEQFLPAILFRALTQDASGRPLLALSLDNGGRAETRGADLRVGLTLARGFHGALEVGVLELRPEAERPGGPIVLNAPEKRARVLFGWRGARGGAEVVGRWRDEFEWASGGFSGPVREATTVDLGGRFRPRDGLELALNVDNALDERHAETFGGDVWGRQARATVSWSFGREAQP